MVTIKPLSLKIISNRIFFLFSLMIIMFISVFLKPEYTVLPACYFRKITGFSCPTCGLSRSFFAISHLHFKDSFGYHLMGPIIFVIMLLLILKFSVEFISGREVQINVKGAVIKIALTAFIGVWIIFCIIRFVNEI